MKHIWAWVVVCCLPVFAHREGYQSFYHTLWQIQGNDTVVYHFSSTRKADEIHEYFGEANRKESTLPGGSCRGLSDACLHIGILLGGQLGLAQPANFGIRNVDAFRFKVVPIGVGTQTTKTQFVKFDCTRQVNTVHWEIKNGNKQEVHPDAPFPKNNRNIILDNDVNDDPGDFGQHRLAPVTD